MDAGGRTAPGAAVEGFLPVSQSEGMKPSEDTSTPDPLDPAFVKYIGNAVETRRALCEVCEHQGASPYARGWPRAGRFRRSDGRDWRG